MSLSFFHPQLLIWFFSCQTLTSLLLWILWICRFSPNSSWLSMLRHVFPYLVSFWTSLCHDCIKAYLFFSNQFFKHVLGMHFICSFLRCFILLEAEVSLPFPPFLCILKDGRIQWLHSIPSSLPNPVLGRFRCFSPGGSWSLNLYFSFKASVFRKSTWALGRMTYM